MYLIHVLGEAPKEMNNREDAMFHLGARYGVNAYNKAVTDGYIKYTETYVKVVPFKVKDTKTVATGSGIRKEVILERLHDVVGQSEQLVCDHSKHTFFRVIDKTRKCNGCGELYEAN